MTTHGAPGNFEVLNTSGANEDFETTGNCMHLREERNVTLLQAAGHDLEGLDRGLTEVNKDVGM